MEVYFALNPEEFWEVGGDIITNVIADVPFHPKRVLSGFDLEHRWDEM